MSKLKFQQQMRRNRHFKKLLLALLQFLMAKVIDANRMF